jgi:hypothetical protein
MEKGGPKPAFLVVTNVALAYSSREIPANT